MRRFIRALAVVLMTVAAGVALPATSHAAGSPQLWENYQSKLCMGVSAGNVTDGTAIITWGCNGNSDQGWILDPVTVNNQTWYLFRDGTNPNQCLSVAAKSKSAGALLVIWHCKPSNDDQDQLWLPAYIPRAPFPLAEIENFNSGLYIIAGTANPGSPVGQMPITPSTQLDVWSNCPQTLGVSGACPGV